MRTIKCSVGKGYTAVIGKKTAEEIVLLNVLEQCTIV